MPIPSVAEFTRNTNKSINSRLAFLKNATPFRGNKIKIVDEALAKYHNLPSKNPTNLAKQQEYINTLHELVMACLGWLGVKKGVKRQELAADPGYVPSAANVRRTAAIKALANEAIKELYSKINLYGFVSVDEMHVIKFNYKKIIAKEDPNHLPLALRQNGGNGQAVKNLGAFYLPERATYLDRDKRSNISGSKVHDVHASIVQRINQATQNLPQGGTRQEQNDAFDTNYRRVFQGYGRVESGQFKNEIVRLATTGVDDLTQDDWLILEQIAKASGGIMELGSTQYFDRNERLGYIAVPDGQGILRDEKNKTITTDDTRVFMYAMDESGNLFYRWSEEFDTSKYANFNHSGFNAGKPVICAGTLRIRNGRLMSISNMSGHYKPSAQNLQNCLKVLQADQVNLSQTTVQCMQPNGSMNLYRAPEFVVNTNCMVRGNTGDESVSAFQ